MSAYRTLLVALNDAALEIHSGNAEDLLRALVVEAAAAKDAELIEVLGASLVDLASGKETADDVRSMLRSEAALLSVWVS